MAKYIPEEHYVGHRPSENDSSPLAFMTPEGTDSQAKKRKETVTSWSGGKNGVFKVLKNKPMKGFKIAKEVRRWRTSNVLWRVDDPRGFTLEISSGNMAYIMTHSTIKDGEIENELVWCRNGADNFLLPVGTEEHESYLAFTEAPIIKAADLSVGDVLNIENNKVRHVYLGRYSIFYSGMKIAGNYRRSEEITGKIIDVKRLHLFAAQDENGKHYAYQIRTSIPKAARRIFSVVAAGSPKDETDYSYLFKEGEDFSNFSSLYGNEDIIHMCQKSYTSKAIAKTLKLVDINDSLSYERYSTTYYTKLLGSGLRQHLWPFVVINSSSVNHGTRKGTPTKNSTIIQITTMDMKKNTISSVETKQEHRNNSWYGRNTPYFDHTTLEEKAQAMAIEVDGETINFI